MPYAAQEQIQNRVIAFLQDHRTHGLAPGEIVRIDTHGAVVFLAGNDAYKLKRAIHYPYMDFSTLEKRRAACENELLINRRTAPSIYLDCLPIACSPSGKMAFGQAGEIVEWVVHMRRFDQDMTLDRLAARGEVTNHLSVELAHVIAEYHNKAKPYPGADLYGDMCAIISENATEFALHPDLFMEEDQALLQKHNEDRLFRVKLLLQERAELGFVRRCHGDLHLRNIVMIDGQPVPFDALEFDPHLARIDTLYDLAFLIMDLKTVGLHEQANVLLNNYLWAHSDIQLDGLAAMPLYLSCRAAIRAKVAASLLDLNARQDGSGLYECSRYFASALDYLCPPAPAIIAVGGLSGTGKTSVARALAPDFGAAPGAIHIRSDVERKRIFNCPETTPLGPEAYTQDVTARVYERINDLAHRVVTAGHWCIVDAVFSAPEERSQIEATARNANVPFVGLWLHAEEKTLLQRVAQRQGDASDATASVVARQAAYDTGKNDWVAIDSDQTLADVIDAARPRLEIALSS